MQLNETPALPPHHAPNSLKKLLFIFGVLVVVALGYLVWAQNSDPDTTDYSSASVKKSEETTTTEDSATTSSPNIVKYSLASKGVNLQFELPDNYGAGIDVQGEGVLSIKFNIGKYVSQYGAKVIETNSMFATYVKIVPSYDSSIVTLANWQNEDISNFNNYKADLQKTEDVKVGGVEAKKYTIGGFGEFRVIQFVKDKNFYEIRNEVGSNEDAVAKIVATLKFQ